MEFSKRTYQLKTCPDDPESLPLFNYDDVEDRTSFERESDLELFEQWMAFVHSQLMDAGLTESCVYESLNINIWSHRQIYNLFKTRKVLKQFVDSLQGFEGRLRFNHHLEESNTFKFFDQDKFIGED